MRDRDAIMTYSFFFLFFLFEVSLLPAEFRDSFKYLTWFAEMRAASSTESVWALSPVTLFLSSRSSRGVCEKLGKVQDHGKQNSWIFLSTLPISQKSQGARRTKSEKTGRGVASTREQMGCADSETTVRAH
ncbi:hypothetical protein LX36DRAFT_319267 [Colletotrichum falcatum]|nr:hypothetical protein LX36DRAFT_319267 [Colletotrichum falcatum]